MDYITFYRQTPNTGNLVRYFTSDLDCTIKEINYWIKVKSLILLRY